MTPAPGFLLEALSLVCISVFGSFNGTLHGSFYATGLVYVLQTKLCVCVCVSSVFSVTVVSDDGNPITTLNPAAITMLLCEEASSGKKAPVSEETVSDRQSFFFS